jgi:hypothetical protein
VARAKLLIARQRNVAIAVASQTMRQRDCIDQRQVGALSQLRAGAVCGVAHHNNAAAYHRLYGNIAVGRERKILEALDFVHHRGCFRPYGKNA